MSMDLDFTPMAMIAFLAVVELTHRIRERRGA